jgi:NAD(P)-dependent dehydrogenase (short-subunit alcohol dehydrogenase family)
MSVTYDFRGQVALVTGAAMGMGLATARAFADAGAAVALADIDEAALNAGVSEMPASRCRLRTQPRSPPSTSIGSSPLTCGASGLA